MTDDEAILNALDLNEAFKRSLCTARRAMRAGCYVHPIQRAELEKYTMAANDALEDALQFVPNDVLSQLKLPLRSRRRFLLLTWRWRFAFKYDEETEKLDALRVKWGQAAKLRTN